MAPKSNALKLRVLQGRHVVALESQLKTAKGDNDDLVRRIKTIKDAASAGYKKTAAR